MSSTFSNLKFELIGNGEQSGTWGTTTNGNIGTAIEQAIVGMATLDSGDFAANVCTLTLTNTTAAQDARALCLNIDAGAVSAAGTINVPAIQKPYIVINGSSYTVTVKVSGLTGVAVPAGTRTVVYNNGTDVGTQLNWLNSLTLGTALPIASGGTGTTSTTFVNLATNVTGTLPIANGGSAATTAATARTNFGATTLGANLFIISNPSAITFPRFNADNTVSSLTAADFRTAIGAGTATGTVTSVGGTGTVNGITLTGTVTSSGNLTLGGALSGVSLTTQVTGTLPIANGGTGTTSTTFANLTTNVTGTLPTANGGTGTTSTTFANLTTNVTGTLPTANGGTGNVNGTVAKLATTNFSIEESGGKLIFKYGATAIASMDSSGNFIALANVTAYGTP